MNRFEEIREIVDDLLLRQQDLESRRCGYVHLYGVSAVCRLLALKRGLDLEIARIAGLFHDIYVYTTGLTVCHAVNSAEQVRVILRDLTLFTADEQRIICSAIFHHSDKKLIHQPYDELLKDADLFQHYLDDPRKLFKKSVDLPQFSPGLNGRNFQRLIFITGVMIQCFLQSGEILLFLIRLSLLSPMIISVLF